jgi:hypothetical protein
LLHYVSQKKQHNLGGDKRMRKWNLGAGILAAVALASCGGGGGGGGGGLAGIAVKPALTTSVKINGQAATA